MTDVSTFTADPGQFQVTPEMLQAYDTNGFILVRNLFSKEEIDHVRSAVDDPEGVTVHQYGRADGASRDTKLCLWQHPGNDVTGVMARINKVAGTMEKLMGGDEVYHYHTKVIMKDAKVGGAKVWHQDYGYWFYNGCLLPEMGSVFMPLDECRRENGCLQVMPGTHRLGRLDHVTVGEQLQAEPLRLAQIEQRYPVHFVEMSLGDVLFFHCNLLHSSSQNHSNMRRWVLISAYNKKLNNPYKAHHHPQYTPLEKLEDSALLQCREVRDLRGKDFLKPEMEKSYLGDKQDSEQ